MSRIVWAPPTQHVAVWKNPPEILLSSLAPKSLSAWREKNSWADNIEMIVFTDDTPPRHLGYRYFAFAGATGEAPHVVVNHPSAALHELESIKAADIAPALAYVTAVASIGRALNGKRCAWLQPESDHSIGAIILATTMPIVVALSSRNMMDSIGARAAGHHGVNVQTLGTIKGQGRIDV